LRDEWRRAAPACHALLAGECDLEVIGRAALKALVLTAYGGLELQELAPPEVGPRDVLVRVMACGSDVHGLDGISTGAPTKATLD
jgi:hypothetical protein